jgi:hypothetical protein
VQQAQTKKTIKDLLEKTPSALYEKDSFDVSPIEVATLLGEPSLMRLLMEHDDKGLIFHEAGLPLLLMTALAFPLFSTVQEDTIMPSLEGLRLFAALAKRTNTRIDIREHLARLASFSWYSQACACWEEEQHRPYHENPSMLSAWDQAKREQGIRSAASDTNKPAGKSTRKKAPLI